MATQIARDPFARASLMRETIRVQEDGQTCTWCGNVSHPRASVSRRLFRYFWEDDSGRGQTGHNIDKLFCSVSCFRTYTS